MDDLGIPLSLETPIYVLSIYTFSSDTKSRSWVSIFWLQISNLFGFNDPSARIKISNTISWCEHAWNVDHQKNSSKLSKMLQKDIHKKSTQIKHNIEPLQVLVWFDLGGAIGSPNKNKKKRIIAERTGLEQPGGVAMKNGMRCQINNWQQGFFSERERHSKDKRNLQGYLLPTVARHFPPYFEVNQRF